MPKEKLNSARSERHHDSVITPGEDGASVSSWDEMLPVVSLHWSKNHAQLGIVLDISTVRRLLSSLEDGASTVEVFAPPLERWEMNNSIKTLRRARAAVYGTDE